VNLSTLYFYVSSKAKNPKIKIMSVRVGLVGSYTP